MLEIALKLGVEIWTEAGMIDLDVRNGRIPQDWVRRG